jgi:hypothetical protein
VWAWLLFISPAWEDVTGISCASSSSFLLLVWLVVACSATGVVCDGTDLSIQDGLYGIAGATLQSRAEESEGT